MHYTIFARIICTIHLSLFVSNRALVSRYCTICTKSSSGWSVSGTRSNTTAIFPSVLASSFSLLSLISISFSLTVKNFYQKVICTFIFHNIISSSYLPKSHNMLHYKAYRSNSNPAARPHNNRLSAGLNQLDNISIKPYCRHSKNYKKFTEFF